MREAETRKYPIRSLKELLEFVSVEARSKLAIACLLIFALSAPAQNDRLAQADQLFAERPDLAEVRHAISFLTELVKEDSDNYEALWRLAKYYHFLGTQATGKKEKQAALGRGVEAGKRAVALRPNRPEAHFWLAANYGERLQRKSIFTRWTLIKPMRRELEAVIRIDPGHENGSAYAALGRLLSEAPGLFGGDVKRGIRYLEKAVEIGPDNSMAKLFLAQSYLKVGRKQEAKRWLESVLKQAPDKGYQFEYSENRQDAERLLNKHFNSREHIK